MQAISKADAKSLGLKTYSTGKPCAFDHPTERYTRNSGCVQCAKEKSNLARISNPEKIAEYKRIWNIKNKDKIKASRKPRESRAKKVEIVNPHLVVSRKHARELGLMHYYTGKLCINGHYADRFTKTAICKECQREYSAKVRREQPERQKKYLPAAYQAIKRRRKKDPDYKMMWVMRDMVRRVIRGAKIKKNASTIDLLGYSPDQFRLHIESMWLEGMNWENHGEWHVDHKIPLSIMIKRGEKDPSIINALSNLQPLWATDNMKKSAKIL